MQQLYWFVDGFLLNSRGFDVACVACTMLIDRTSNEVKGQQHFTTIYLYSSVFGAGVVHVTQTISFVPTWTISQPIRHTHRHPPPKIATDSVRSKLPPLYAPVSPVARLLWLEASRA